MIAPLLLVIAVAGPPEDLAAVGVVVRARPQESVAVLRGAGRSRVVGVGDAAFGGRVEAITAGGVTIVFEGQPRYLRVTSGPSGEAAAPHADKPSSATAQASESESPALALDRREVERRIGAEAPRILAETTLVPVTDGDRQVGFTLTRIPEGTILTEAGVRAGDVLTHVNDIAIDSLATLISLWPRLQGESVVRAVVLRNGRPVTLTVSLR